MKRVVRLTEGDLRRVILEVLSGSDMPTEDEYQKALAMIDNVTNTREYDYYKDIIDRYESGDELYWKLKQLSANQKNTYSWPQDSYWLMTNGKIVGLYAHGSVRDIDGLNMVKVLNMGNIRLVGQTGDDVIYIELSKCPNDKQVRMLYRLIASCKKEVYVDISKDVPTIKSFSFDRTKVGADFIVDKITGYFDK